MTPPQANCAQSPCKGYQSSNSNHLRSASSDDCNKHTFSLPPSRLLIHLPTGKVGHCSTFNAGPHLVIYTSPRPRFFNVHLSPSKKIEQNMFSGPMHLGLEHRRIVPSSPLTLHSDASVECIGLVISASQKLVLVCSDLKLDRESSPQ